MTSRTRCTKSAIAMALAAGFGLSAPAQAINLAPNGKGEVLIYPYYTVHNGFDTLVSVTNTSDRTVLANLRLREAKNGRPVREFHLALSPHDVWTGAVTTDGGSGALIRTFDATCTAPALQAGPNGSTQIALTSSNYTDPFSDNGGSGLERVQEGFIEVIEMAISTVPESSIATTGSSIETSAQHVSGTPRSCATVQDAFLFPLVFLPTDGAFGASGTPFSSFEAPKNVLFGSSTLINVGSGHAYDVTPTTIQNFRDTTPIIVRSDSGPTLAHGDTGMTATQFDRDGKLITTGNITSSIDAVSVLLMADTLTNEYAIGSTETSRARTDWVITFPTKHFYTDRDRNQPAVPPFTQPFGASGSCDLIALTVANRDGLRRTYPGPTPPLLTITDPNPFMCGSTNVMSVHQGISEDTGVLGSTVTANLGTANFEPQGWMTVHFSLVDAQSTGTKPVGSRTPLLGFTGLPAIGFALIERNNNAEAGNNRNFGSGRPHVVELIAP